MRKQIFIYIFFLICINCTSSIFTSSKIFATFNLKVRNKTQFPITAKCISVNGGKKVHFYYNKTWENELPQEKTIMPDTFFTFHIGAYIKFERWFWITFAKYIEKETQFSLTISKSEEKKMQSVIITWKGAEGNHNPDEHLTRFYYYQYTGSFILNNVKTDNTNDLAKPDFNIFGDAKFKNKKYANDKILTSDNLWNPDSGFYLVEIEDQTVKTENDSFVLYEDK